MATMPPPDIMAIVEQLFEPYSYLADGPNEADVARLILAERQRCAALARAEEARQRGLHAAATEDRFRLVHGVGAEIVLSLVAAIEKGTQP